MGGIAMPKYLFQVSYTIDGAKGVMKGGGSARRKAVEEMLAASKGKLEAFYFTFGADDVVLIAELPDHVAASAIALTVAAAGGARTKTTVLVTPEEVDEASKRQVNYRPPGQ
jgi:uncharacterized protein with GYD domain